MSDTQSPPVILIDAFAQIYRGYYAIRRLTNSQQMPVNAIFAITKFLLKMHQNYPSDYGAVVFDRGKPDFRLKVAPQYKANRPPMPDDMRVQLDYIETMITAFGWPKFGCEGFEADDVIAAITQDMPQYEFRIVSADKDLAQLISPRVKMLIPGSKGAMQLRGPEEVKEKFQVEPEQIIDYLAMLGDSADNIPGVAGVGAKTAAALLQQAGSIAKMLETPELIVKDKLRDKILASAELLQSNIALIKLNEAVPERPWLESQAITRRQPDWEQIAELCRSLELKTILREVEKLAVTDTAKAHSPSDNKTTLQPAFAIPEPVEKYAPDLFDLE